MPWAEAKPEIVVPLVNPVIKETIWFSSYPDSLERWTKDFTKGRYTLVGEYTVDATKTLYRFEIDEEYRNDIPTLSAHFQNVLIENTPTVKSPEVV